MSVELSDVIVSTSLSLHFCTIEKGLIYALVIDRQNVFPEAIRDERP